MVKKRMKMIEFYDGTLIIEPCRATGTHRYEPLLDTEFGTVTTTKRHYRVLLMFPRKAGLIAAVRHLICECSRIATLLLNLDVKHNFK